MNTNPHKSLVENVQRRVMAALAVLDASDFRAPQLPNLTLAPVSTNAVGSKAHASIVRNAVFTAAAKAGLNEAGLKAAVLVALLAEGVPSVCSELGLREDLGFEAGQRYVDIVVDHLGEAPLLIELKFERPTNLRYYQGGPFQSMVDARCVDVGLNPLNYRAFDRVNPYLGAFRELCARDDAPSPASLEIQHGTMHQTAGEWIFETVTDQLTPYLKLYAERSDVRAHCGGRVIYGVVLYVLADCVLVSDTIPYAVEPDDMAELEALTDDLQLSEDDTHTPSPST